MATLGIDFGSSNTTVSWINPRYGKPEAIKFNGDGSVKYPSVILGIGDGLVMGHQALSYLEEVDKLEGAQRIEFLSNFISSLKRILEPDGVEMIGDRDYTHLQLLNHFFSQIKKLAEEDSGQSFDAAVISHPVDFRQDNIQLLVRSLQGIGFRQVATKMEPLAAVAGYGIDHVIPDGQGILVFDFGGGTIDVAYVKKIEGALRVVCEPKGNRACGGQDIDMLLYEDLRKKLQGKYGIDISSDNYADYGMLNACRRLKEHFSSGNDTNMTPILFTKDGKLISYKYMLNRESFNNIICPKVSDAILVAKSVIGQAQKKGCSIEKVLLIGGSSHLTLVRQELMKLLPDASIEKCGEKDIAVALGNLSDLVIKEEPVVDPPSPPSPNPPSSQPKPSGPAVRIDPNNDGILDIW